MPLNAASTAADRTYFKTLAGVLLLMLVTALFWMPPQDHPVAFPGSRSIVSGGAKAAYELLGKSGYRISRWRQSPLKLPSGHDKTLILANPILAAGAKPPERDAIMRFARSGGRVLVTGGAATFLLPQNWGTSISPLDVSWQKYPALFPGKITAHAAHIVMRARVNWNEYDPNMIPLYGRKDRAVAEYEPVGAGAIIVWGGSTPLTNAGLLQSGNLQFFFDCIGRSPRTVLWDEYFHGRRRSLLPYLGSGGLPWGLIPLGLLFLAALWTYGRRAGPLQRESQDDRYSPLEFLTGVAGMYERAGAFDVALAIAREEWLEPASAPAAFTQAPSDHAALPSSARRNRRMQKAALAEFLRGHAARKSSPRGIVK